MAVPTSNNGSDNSLTPPWDIEFQCKLLSLMWNNPPVFLQARDLLRAKDFGGEMKDPSGKPNVLEILYSISLEIYMTYHIIPNALAFRQEINTKYQDPMRECLLQWLEYIISLHVTEGDYLLEGGTQWVRRRTVFEMLPQIIEAHNHQETEEAERLMDDLHHKRLLATLRPPERSVFFKGLDSRQERRYLMQDSEFFRMRFPTGVNVLDERLGGGLARKEFGLVLADTNVGKGVCLVNFGYHAAFSGAHVLHITLEDSLEDVEDRYETRFTGGKLKMDEVSGYEMPQEVYDLLNRAYKNTRNHLVIAAMNSKWDRTVDDIEEELYRCQADGFFPDVVVLDYADIVKARGDHTQRWEQVRSSYRDLKTFNTKHKVGLWTGAQANRAPNNARRVDPNHIIRENDISEGYDKMRTVDIALSINQTDVEKDNGEFRFYLIKARNHPARTLFKCTQDLSRMIFAFPQASVLRQEVRWKSSSEPVVLAPNTQPMTRVPDEVLKNAIKYPPAPIPPEAPK